MTSHVTAGDGGWLSTNQAAWQLGIVPRTLYRLIDRGELPAYRFGRVIRIQAIDVDAYIATCRVQPGSGHLHEFPAGERADPDGDLAE